MSSQKNPDEKATPSADSATSPAKPPKKKFKYTRELVRIALNAGMTQEDIAKACRVSQPVVSKWAKGKGHAAEQSIAPLLKLYGSHLSRSTARIYLVMDATDPRWESSAMGQAFLAGTAAMPQPATTRLGITYHHSHGDSRARELAELIGLRLSRSVTWDELKDVIQVRFASEYPTKLVQVEGSVIFRHAFVRLDGRLQRNGIERFWTPIARWSLHDGLRGKFVLVRQYRRHLQPPEMTEWDAQRTRQEVSVVSRKARDVASDLTLLPSLSSHWVDSAEDSARWICRVERPMAIEELLAFVDNYVQDTMQLHTVHDQKTLPFLVRKALIERGYEVPGLERIANYE